MLEKKTKTLIIGGGAAGLNTAINLKEECTILKTKKSNSIISPWNINKGKNLKKEMLEKGNKLNKKPLVNTFVKKIDDTINDLKDYGIKFKESNLGLIPDYNKPGLKSMKIMKSKTGEKTKILNGTVKQFLINENNDLQGVIFKMGNEKMKIFFENLVLAGGGISSFFKNTTGEKTITGSILALCYESGIRLRDLEFFMFHPFLIDDKKLPNVLLSGKILQKMDFKNEKGKEFLSKKVRKALKNNKHHNIFPQMTREFYKESLKNKVFGELNCSKQWFEEFKKDNEYGYIFKGFKKEDVSKIKLRPAFHYLIGGIDIDKNAKTNKNNVYAAGEITGGLHGSNRLGGLGILEALIFGKIAAQQINNSSGKSKYKKTKSIGNLGLGKKIKKLVWENLGPIKSKKDLKKFKNKLNSKKTLTSQERLIKIIINICLKRTVSIGSFHCKNLNYKNSGKNSLIKNGKIVFK